MRSNGLERSLRLIQVLQGGQAATVDEIAARIGVSRRTIFRDLGVLSRAGLTYEFDRQARKYSASKSTLSPPASLTHEEAGALLLASRMLARSAIVPHPEVAQSAAMKLESMLPEAILDTRRSCFEWTEVRPAPVADSSTIADLLSLLQTALSRRLKVRARYDSKHERKVLEMTLHPYRIAFVHRRWYLIAFWEARECIQTLSVGRILHLRPLFARYRLDQEFNLDEYLGNAWVMIRGNQRFHVRVRFLRDVADEIDETRWHRTQQTYFQEDGSLMFEADVDGISEISRWILGYGDQAEVLEPLELRELVAVQVQNLTEVYKDLSYAAHRA